LAENRALRPFEQRFLLIKNGLFFRETGQDGTLKIKAQIAKIRIIEKCCLIKRCMLDYFQQAIAHIYVI
jgi:hypothetical protein